MKLYYSPDYCKSTTEWDTTRKAAWIAASLRDNPIPGVRLTKPQPLSLDLLHRVHTAQYINAIRTGEPHDLANSSGLTWNKNVWSAVLSSNGGAVAAALEALKTGTAGSLSSGLHHAHAERGGGFCTINGLVLAAVAASTVLYERKQSAKILILDLDAHYGDGTEALVASRPWIKQVDIKPDFGWERNGDLDWNFRAGKKDYLDLIRDELHRLGSTPWDLCIYNAGMDPHEDCHLGGVPGITDQVMLNRESLVFDWCGTQKIPVAFVLAGGYTGQRMSQDHLVQLHRLTITAACMKEDLKREEGERKAKRSRFRRAGSGR